MCPRPFTTGSVATMAQHDRASAAELQSLLDEADALYNQSLAGVHFDEPPVGTAPAELDSHWQSLMSVLAAEQQEAVSEELRAVSDQLGRNEHGLGLFLLELLELLLGVDVDAAEAEVEEDEEEDGGGDDDDEGEGEDADKEERRQQARRRRSLPHGRTRRWPRCTSRSRSLPRSWCGATRRGRSWRARRPGGGAPTGRRRPRTRRRV